jgi:hypothetical protein
MSAKKKKQDDHEHQHFELGLVIHRAEILALVSICEDIAKAAGITRFYEKTGDPVRADTGSDKKKGDALTIPELFKRRRVQELEVALIDIEDIDPAHAARIQQYADKIRRQAGLSETLE